MGTRGIVGFIENGVRRGAYNHSDSYPWGLGDAIIKFIMSFTEEQWDEMAKKVAGLDWISEDQIKLFDESAQLHLHFPSMPEWAFSPRETEATKLAKAAELEAFRSANPDFSPSISDKEIFDRYIYSHGSLNDTISALGLLRWIAEYDELIQTFDQHDLLERIWDGREKYLVDESGGCFIDYEYFIDFENRVMEVEGAGDDILVIPFEDLKIGIITEMMVDSSEDEEDSGME